ncbi:hypothetical protein [Desulfofundulus sp.]|uniref:hypothetical protein n=1 Tax=Desulfofundulus sp. TaxID=2282750 RepID=UPI003C7161D2
MRYIVILHDMENEEWWYAPVVEAPGMDDARAAAEDAYSSCTAVAVLDESDVEYMLDALRSAEPNITVYGQV